MGEADQKKLETGFDKVDDVYTFLDDGDDWKKVQMIDINLDRTDADIDIQVKCSLDISNMDWHMKEDLAGLKDPTPSSSRKASGKKSNRPQANSKTLGTLPGGTGQKSGLESTAKVPAESPSKGLSNTKGISDEIKSHFDTIIVHIHGGAFIAMSSSYHQSYLRKYANALKIPIFSIDYRLAPEYRYPLALQDCIKAYTWILQFLKEVVGADVKKIIVFGDSAGGNLGTALTYWTIENDMRVPD